MEQQIANYLEKHADIKNSQQRVAILFMALFATFPKNFAKDLKKNTALLARVAEGPEGQKALLGCIEHFCTQIQPDLLKSCGGIIKICYDTDLLEVRERKGKEGLSFLSFVHIHGCGCFCTIYIYIYIYTCLLSKIPKN